MALVSVIIPIYNISPYVFQCINSATKQTYKNIEIILVNDGSTDGCIEICEYFRKTDTRVKLINQNNQGLVAARKSGINAASGTYIFYLDGDDWIDENCIETYIQEAQKNNSDIVIGGHKREFLGNFKKINNHTPPGFYQKKSIEEEILPSMIWNEEIQSHSIKTFSWGKLFKKSLIKDIQNSIPNQVVVTEDALLTYPAIAQANSISIIESYCYNYRQRGNSILKSSGINFREEIEKIGIAFQHLYNSLNIKFNFKNQLYKYFYFICTIRSGAFMSDLKYYDKFQIFGDIQPSSKIAIYNSGSFGQNVYKQIKNNKSLHITGWFDGDFMENGLLGMPVKSPEEIKQIDFDYIIIPSFDQETKNEMINYLKKNKIPDKKIRTPNLKHKDIKLIIQYLGFSPENFSPLKDIS